MIHPRNIFLATAAAAALGACATDTGSTDVVSARAELADASGAPRGTATISETGTGIRVAIDARNLPPGVHAAHLHTTGACVPPDFASAGGHWNPLGREHGRENPRGQHMGDMPNLIVGQDGTGVLEITIDGARLAGGDAALLDEDGAAVVIHATADDYRSDPAGNAGARIACGVVAPIG